MPATPEEWSGSPEKRIIRELFRSKKGELAASRDPSGVGRLLENLLKRELGLLARRRDGTDIRFARGHVVEDYSSQKYEGASAAGAGSVDHTGSPRFDIVCYRGDVAWRTHEGLPHAVVPSR